MVSREGESRRHIVGAALPALHGQERHVYTGRLGKSNKSLLPLFFWRLFCDFLLFYLDVTIIRTVVKKISSNEHSCKTCPHGAPHLVRDQTPKPP